MGALAARMRTAAVHVAAAVTSALPAAVIMGAANWGVGERQAAGLAGAAFFVALFHAVFLGLPLAAWAARRGLLRPVICVGVGALAGALPLGLLSVLALPDEASIGGHPTVVHGALTLYGWWERLQLAGMLAGFGAAGGLCYWLTLWVGGQQQPRPAREGTAGWRWTRTALAVSLSVLGTAALGGVTESTRDVTCHNLFRDGRKAVEAHAGLEIDIDSDAWPELRRVMPDYAAAKGLSVRDLSEAQPSVNALAVSLCADGGVNIEANALDWQNEEGMRRQGWTEETISNFTRRKLFVVVYQLTPGQGWRGAAEELYVELDAAFPGRVRRTDGHGRAPPDAPAPAGASAPKP